MKEKEAQKIVDELCKFYEIPKIMVLSMEDLSGNDAEFHPDEYVIYYDKNRATKDDITHEIFHYIIRLIGRCEDLEEHVVQRATQGFNAYKNKFKHLKFLK